MLPRRSTPALLVSPRSFLAHASESSPNYAATWAPECYCSATPIAPADVRSAMPVLIFTLDGVLDRWEAFDHHNYGPQRIVYQARDRAVTVAEVQAWLEARAA